MTRRCMMTAVLVVTLGLSALLAAPGVVKTRDGKTWEGEVTEAGEKVVVKSRGVEVTIDRADVASIEYKSADVQKEYEQRLAKLPPGAGAREHLELARWLFDSRQYQLARTEADTAMKLDPGNEEATKLLETIRWQIILERRGGQPPVIPATTRAIGGAPTQRKLLDADQIQAMRREELRTDDAGVKFRFEKDVLRRYAESANINLAQIVAAPDIVKAREILGKGTPEMRNDVKITSDPLSMADWKRIQPFVLNTCATASCHGANATRTFILYGRPDSDFVAYTNFYILNQVAHRVDDVQRRMIDRTRPAESLLLQYGLPRDQADLRHPEMLGFRTMFPAGRRDPNYQRTLDWLRNRLVPIEPNYGFEFDIPRGVPATQPTTQPAD